MGNILQMSRKAHEPSLEPRLRQKYGNACLKLSRIEQSLRLYKSAEEGYRKCLMSGHPKNKEWVQEKYKKIVCIVGELKRQKLLLETFGPDFYFFEDIEDFVDRIDARSKPSRLYQEVGKLELARELRRTIEQLAKKQISFDEAKPILEKYLADSAR